VRAGPSVLVVRREALGWMWALTGALEPRGTDDSTLSAIEVPRGAVLSNARPCRGT